jgi:hypothetical protein
MQSLTEVTHKGGKKPTGFFFEIHRLLCSNNNSVAFLCVTQWLSVVTGFTISARNEKH